MLDVISIGSICMDVFLPAHPTPAPGGLSRIPSLTITPGGNGSNTAVTCARLGLRSALAGILGDDLFGRHLREWLTTEGVEVSLLDLLPGRQSPVTVVENDASGERSFIYFPGTDDDFRLPEPVFTAPAGLVHLAAPELYAGWWPGECLAAVRRLAAAGRRVSLDTFVAEPGTARADHEPLLPHLEVVLPNEEEARALTGQRDPEDMARYFLDRGVKTAAIKLGGRGALVAAAGERHRIPIEDVEVVDTCGAGDSFSGGFLAAWLRGLPLEECGRIGCALGTRCVTREGSLTGTRDPAFLSVIADRLAKGCRRPILPLND
jgi:sugar/nucleoside kinase (ribokinase family)